MSHVDTTSPVTHVSLCAGYGGIDLGLNRAVGNLRTIAFSEIEAFACANLVSKMEAGLLDAAPIWTNLKTFPWGEFRGLVDILSGGYPCQPFSAAGKRLGTEDPRHLWPYIADGIAAMRPSVCFFENVEGHISLGLPDVIEDLGRLGYRTTWGIFSAAEVGAVHQRKRVFIMALSNSFGSSTRISRSLKGNEGQSGIPYDGCGQVWPSRPGQPQFSWEPPRVVGNAKGRGNGQLTTQQQRGGSFGGSMQEGADVSDPISKRPHISTDEQIMEGERCNQLQVEQSRDSEDMEDSKLLGRGRRSDGDEGGNCGQIQTAGSCGGWSEDRKAEPSMGGDPNGPSCGVGHAELCQPNHADGGFASESGDGKLGNPNSYGREKLHSKSGCRHEGEQENGGECSLEWASSYPDLCVSCDNRTDELRLLGNGVVPATAELAFRTLWEELTWK